MLYTIVICLLIFTYFAYRILDKDYFAPSVIMGITIIFGGIVGCFANLNWKVHVPFEVLLLYMLGYGSLILGEIVVKNKSYQMHLKFKYTQQYTISEINIPNKFIFMAIVFSIVVVMISKNKSVQIAYENGYTGEEWQSMPVYVKHAISRGNAHYGVVLSTCRQILENITYLSVFIFIFNGSIAGFAYAVKKHFVLFVFPLLYAYMLSFQGQRSNFIGIIVFSFYAFILQSKHLRVKLNYKKIIIICVVFVILFLLYFTIVGNFTGRSANSNAIENACVYIGSSILDCAEYINSPQSKYSFTWGTRTFSGLYSTIMRIFPFLPTIHANSNAYTFQFVTFANGSESNVYGPFAKFFSEFGYLGVIILCFVQGLLYRILYNTCKNPSATPWQMYLFSFISYGIVIAFVDEQQLSLLFSVYQLMHLFIGYILLNYCIHQFSEFPAKHLLKRKSFFV